MSDERKDVTITVRVDRSLKSKMDERPEINWSAVSRKAIRSTIEDLEVMDEITAKNWMTEVDAKEIAENRTDGGTTLDRSGDAGTGTETDTGE